jgi:hypothetical protein
MNMILDADIPHAFWQTLDAARSRAMLEAVDTGGIILEVTSIEMQGLSLTVVGSVPVDALEVRVSGYQERIMIRPQGLGRFHATWRSLILPEETIGFLVLRPPVTLVGRSPPTGLDNVRVAMEVKRCFASILSGFIGQVCCIGCNAPIPKDRLKAIPGVRRCIYCQQKKEEMKKWKTYQANT